MKRLVRQGERIGAVSNQSAHTRTRWSLGRAAAISGLFHLGCMLALAEAHSLWRPMVPLAVEPEMTVVGIEAGLEAGPEGPEATPPMLPTAGTDEARALAAVASTPAPRPAPRRRPPVIRLGNAPEALALGPGTTLPPAEPPKPANPLEKIPTQVDEDATARGEEPVTGPARAQMGVFHVSAGVAQALRVYDVFPSMPDAMRAAGLAAAVNVEICVSNLGDVSEVTMNREAAPVLKDVLRSAIRTWRYRPLVLAGNATPFCHEMQLRYSMN
jgi:hypothetical protein